MSDINFGNFNNYGNFAPKGNQLPQTQKSMNSAQSNVAKGANAPNGANFNSNIANSPKGIPHPTLPPAPHKIQMFQMQMNNLASLDRALYVKDLMNLPKDMKQLINALQQ